MDKKRKGSNNSSNSKDVSVDVMLEIAGIGGWFLEMEGGRVLDLCWSDITKRIHEVHEDYVPSLESALSFYPAESRLVIERALGDAIANGRSWDLELPFVTHAKRRIWVRAKGRVLQRTGNRVLLAGTFEDITDRVMRMKEHERLSLVVRKMTNAVILTDEEGRTLWVNDAFCAMTGYSHEELVGKKPGQVLQGEKTDKREAERISKAIQERRPIESEIINYRKDGREYWVSMTIMPIENSADGLGGFIAIESDITERKIVQQQAEEEMRRRDETEALLKDVVYAIPSGVIAFDAQEKFLLANRAYLEMYPAFTHVLADGISLREMLAFGVRTGMYSPEISPDSDEEAVRCWVDERAATIRKARSESRVFQSFDGRWFQARDRRSPNGNLVCVRTDITRLKLAEEEIRKIAETDPLTGIANRKVLFEKLSMFMEAKSDDLSSGIFVVFDVDHFKSINDTLGHDVGDDLLRHIATTVSSSIRSIDIAARLGGDEFAMILCGIKNEEEAKNIIQRLFNRITSSIADMENIPYTLSISMGAALFPKHGKTPESLYKAADCALYESKSNGRGQWTIHHDLERDNNTRKTRSTMITALRSSVEKKEIDIVLQPQIDLMNGSHIGFEVLSRWSYEGNQINPVEFIRIATEGGFLNKLDIAVLSQALRGYRLMLDHGLSPGKLSFNACMQMLMSGRLADDIFRACKEFRVPVDVLAVEVTEHVVFDRSLDRIKKTLNELKDMGISIVIDDFGTGYASLRHLKEINIIDAIKIDKSFTSYITHKSPEQKITYAIIALANALGMNTIAEGIETRQQHDCLLALGCKAGQGYLYSAPLTLEDAMKRLVDIRKVT